MLELPINLHPCNQHRYLDLPSQVYIPHVLPSKGGRDGGGGGGQRGGGRGGGGAANGD